MPSSEGVRVGSAADAPTAAEVCEFAGHEWTDAGGGLLICLRCETEEWAEWTDEGDR